MLPVQQRPPIGQMQTCIGNSRRKRLPVGGAGRVKLAEFGLRRDQPDPGVGVGRVYRQRSAERTRRIFKLGSPVLNTGHSRVFIITCVKRRDFLYQRVGRGDHVMSCTLVGGEFACGRVFIPHRAQNKRKYIMNLTDTEGRLPMRAAERRQPHRCRPCD